MAYVNASVSYAELVRIIWGYLHVFELCSFSSRDLPDGEDCLKVVICVSCCFHIAFIFKSHRNCMCVCVCACKIPSLMFCKSGWEIPASGEASETVLCRLYSVWILDICTSDMRLCNGQESYKIKLLIVLWTIVFKDYRNVSQISEENPSGLGYGPVVGYGTAVMSLV